MDARQRGATWLLILVLVGRLLGTFDLPWLVGGSARTGSGPPPGPPAGRPAGPEAVAPSPATPAAFAADSTQSAPASVTPIRINTADERQLQALPGVGPVLAQRIVAHRSRHGPFRDLTALRQVKGVGPHLQQRLAPLLRFD